MPAVVHAPFPPFCHLPFAFSLVIARGLLAAFRAVDEYGSLLAVGISMFIGLQAFTNLAVAMGMLPTKGLVLPFISYGGSSLLVNCAAVGILINVSRQRVKPADAGGGMPAASGGKVRRAKRAPEVRARANALQGGRA